MIRLPKSKRRCLETTIFLIFTAIIFIFGIDLAGEFLGVAWARHSVFDIIKIILPLILLGTHAVYTLSLRRAIGFIILMISTGFFCELIGIQHSLLFGDLYTYKHDGLIVFSSIPLFQECLTVKGVPILVPLFWGVFIYAGYSLTSSFLHWINRKKPCRGRKEGLLLVLLVLLDAVVVVKLDLLLDPLLVRMGHWEWQNGGAYYGVPARNYLGWFLVTACASGSFRIFEYFFPANGPAIKPTVALMPVAGYIIFWGIATVSALQQHMYALIAVGFITFIPLALANLLFFLIGINGFRSLFPRHEKTKHIEAIVLRLETALRGE